MFKNILFVCVGNICRSPTAEYWARSELKKAGIADVSVASAGVRAMKLSPIAPEAKLILNRYGIDASGHVGKQISKDHVTQSDLILTMEYWQTEELLHTFSGARGKTFDFGKWNDSEISDPYRKEQIYFEKMFEAIQWHWGSWQDKLWK